MGYECTVEAGLGLEPYEKEQDVAFVRCLVLPSEVA
jgi:hypothetical protein